MSHEIAAQMQRARREAIRWYLLVSLHVARPAGAPVPLLRSVVQATYEDATEHELRRELDYLVDRKLIEVEKSPTDQWHCEINRLGTDLVEYTIPCEPGIARPKYHAG